MLLFLVGCRGGPDVGVGAVRDLGPLETDPIIKGRDGGYSVRFGDRTVWLYGDTILGSAGADGSSWRDNTWSWTSDLDASDGLSGFTQPVDPAGAPNELFPETADEHAYNVAHSEVLSGGTCADPCGGREVLWPKAAVETDAGVLLFYVKIHGEPGAWNFFDRGTGIAIWRDFDQPPERPEVGGVPGEPTLLFGPDELAPGDAAALGPDGRVYAWGRRGDGAVKRERVGRVAPADATDRSAWRWWDGRAWVRDPDRADVLFEGASQLQVWYDDELGRWIALYLAEPSRNLVLRTADAPEGPWSQELHVTDVKPAVGDGWPYCGIAHPELARDGLTYASYYRSTGDWTGELRLLEIGLHSR